MSAKPSRFDSAGWGAFFVIFVIVTALLFVWLYINRERDLSESRLAAYIVTMFMAGVIAAILTTILNSILQYIAARRTEPEADSDDSDPDDNSVR
jgi:ABC-type Fe3+ transport system permease subunit